MSEARAVQEDSTGAPVLATIGIAAIVIVSGIAVLFHVLGRGAARSEIAFGPRGATIIFALSFGTVGALIISRKSRNLIGWVFLTVGILSALQDLADSYGHFIFATRGRETLLARLAVWYEYWIWVPIVGITLASLAFLFPSERFLSRRWKAAFWVAIACIAIASFALLIDPLATAEYNATSPLPLSAGVGAFVQPISDVAPGFLVVAQLLSVVALGVRFIRSVGDERRQLLWLLSSITIIVACLIIFSIVSIVAMDETVTSDSRVVNALEIVMILGLGSIPVAAGAAILKYRLYSIEFVVNRAILYGALAAVITIIYGVAVIAPAALIFGFGAGEFLLPLIATAMIALAIQPLRRRMQRFANRVVYGRRATPYEAMAQFSNQIAGAFSVDEILPRIAQATAEGVGATHVGITLYLPDGTSRTATWPAQTSIGDFERTIPIIHRGEAVGELALTKDPRDPITDVEEKLLADLASQAGPALHNVRLTEELQGRLEQISHQAAELTASRTRIVEAQDHERRRIERDLHDGAQQSLVSMSVMLGLAKQTLERDPAKVKEMLDLLAEEARATVEQLRDLARGIFPPVLTDQGLVPALTAHINKRQIPAVIESSDGSADVRFEPGVEAAVYFCCLEALQNASKHAPGRPIKIWLDLTDGKLRFEIRDTGDGFDPASVQMGSGLENMSDRIESLGGRFEIRSSPGEGTTIAGSIPVHVGAIEDHSWAAASQASESRSGLNSDLEM